MYIHKGYYIDERGRKKEIQRGLPRMQAASINLHGEFLPDIGEIPKATRWHKDALSFLDLTTFPTEELLAYLARNSTNDYPTLGRRLLDFLEINRSPWEEPEAPSFFDMVQVDQDTQKPKISVGEILRCYFGHPMDSLERQLRNLRITKGRPYDEFEYKRLRDQGWTKLACAALYRKGRSRFPHLDGLDGARRDSK